MLAGAVLKEVIEVFKGAVRLVLFYLFPALMGRKYIQSVILRLAMPAAIGVHLENLLVLGHFSLS